MKQSNIGFVRVGSSFEQVLDDRAVESENFTIFEVAVVDIWKTRRDNSNPFDRVRFFVSIVEAVTSS